MNGYHGYNRLCAGDDVEMEKAMGWILKSVLQVHKTIGVSLYF